MTTMRLIDLASTFHVQVKGDADVEIAGVAPLAEATGEMLSFYANPAYKEDLATTKAGAVLVKAADADLLPGTCVALITPNPYAAYARIMQKFYPPAMVIGGVSRQAVQSGEAQVDETARLEPGVVVYAGATIGAGCHIGANTVVGENVTLGAGTRVGPNCTLLNTTIGENCILHAGVCVGQDGFGFAQDGQELIKIPHIGQVIIGNEVELGANTTIDRGALGDTIIGDQCKLDNQVQIAHNVVLGAGCRIASQSGIAGSTTLGDGVVIGGQSGLAGHITVADNVMLGGQSGLTKSVTQKGLILGGCPAVPLTQWKRQQALLTRMVKKNQEERQTKAQKTRHDDA